jgi:hypothetical protein
MTSSECELGMVTKWRIARMKKMKWGIYVWLQSPWRSVRVGEGHPGFGSPPATVMTCKILPCVQVCVLFFIFTANLIKFDLALCVEWAKSQARADRWNEEVVLLDEEMRQMIEYCGWKASWWKQQASQRGDVSPELAEGLLAFAEEQAAIEDSIAVRFASQWAPIRKRASSLITKFWGTEPDGMDIIMSDSEEEIVEFPVGEEDDDGGGSDFDE